MTKNSSLSISIISVCYNSHTVLPHMLDSVPSGIDVVLVDNGSTDQKGLKEIAEKYGANLICNDQNRGFGTACNQGANLAQTDYLLFLNPDAMLTPMALDELWNAAQNAVDYSAFNPALFGANDRPYFKRGSVLLPRSAYALRGQPAQDEDVPVLSGAAMFIRHTAFDAVGGFDENIFLYHEDDDLSLRLAKNVGPLMFVRNAKVIHQGGGSSERTAQNAALKAWHMGRSRVYAARKHGRPGAFLWALFRAILQVLSPVTLLSKRKQAKHIAFLKGVWSMRKHASLATKN